MMENVALIGDSIGKLGQFVKIVVWHFHNYLGSRGTGSNELKSNYFNWFNSLEFFESAMTKKMTKNVFNVDG